MSNDLYALRIMDLKDFSDSTDTSESSSVALGFFDGVHSGHEQIINACVCCPDRTLRVKVNHRNLKGWLSSRDPELCGLRLQIGQHVRLVDDKHLLSIVVQIGQIGHSPTLNAP